MLLILPRPAMLSILVRVEILNVNASFFIDSLLTVSVMMRLTLLLTLARLTSHLASICALEIVGLLFIGFQIFSLFGESFAVLSVQSL